jgi:DNA-binding response OmpR family regulator
MSARRLLVIDDEIDFGRFVSRVASPLGYEVEITTQGKDFKAAVPRFQPDVIVLDIVMPDIDGIELIQWLAARRMAARIVVASGFNPYYAKMAQMLGSVHGKLSITTLLKPIAIADLKAALSYGEEA